MDVPELGVVVLDVLVVRSCVVVRVESRGTAVPTCSSYPGTLHVAPEFADAEWCAAEGDMNTAERGGLAARPCLATLSK